MKNKSINTLNYTGIVSLFRYNGAQKIKIAQIHNTGANPLFEFLSNCLIGEFDKAKATIPAKIMLLNRLAYKDDTSGEEGYSYEPMSGFIYLLKNPESVDKLGESRVRYSFIVPRDYLEDLNSYEDLGLGLYAIEESAHENFSAFCMLGLEKNTIAGTALAVDWELIISNVDSSKITK